MQDSYIGDIGDYGKYGLLRAVCAESLTLAVNWYRTAPVQTAKQNDGKYTGYLSMPQLYREYNPALFDALHKIVNQESDRRIERLEKEGLFQAVCFSDVISVDRTAWHRKALERTQGAAVVFLDPDNGLETARMHRTGGASEKHVMWAELRDYYARRQNVILYQHRPQMTSKEKCIDGVIAFQENYLMADCVKLLEFPKYTNRFYFMFLYREYEPAFTRICSSMAQKWGANGFCREIYK